MSGPSTSENGPIVQSVEYVYDYLNRWIARSIDPDGDGPEQSTDSYFIHDGRPSGAYSLNPSAATPEQIGQIVLQLNESGEVTNRYLWGAAIDQILADEQVHADGTSEVLWTLTDHLHTVRDLAVYDAETAVTLVVNHLFYDAFGRLTTQTDPSVTTLFLFNARPFDPATRLQNNLNRWYDAEVGRWISEDPVGFAAADANLYRYAANSPSNFTDPTGCVWPDAKRLLERYKLWKSLGLSDFEMVKAMIQEALLITKGDVAEAFRLILDVRGIPGVDNDIWASLDHFFNAWTGRNHVPVGPEGFVSAFAANFAYMEGKKSEYLRLHVLRLTSQIPLFKMTIVGPLPWGSGGYDKSKNPVNNH